MQRLKVLVACEHSGMVRDAFSRLGHEATSCDLLSDEGESGGNHYQGDVRDILYDGWDLMVGHPECTYLCSSGMHWTTRGLRDPQLTEDALDFVCELLNAPIPKIAIENPVGCISTRIVKATQYIQPYQFGHDASKTTGLWLVGLPKLNPTQYVAPGRWACCGSWYEEPGQCVCGKVRKPRWGNQTPRGQDSRGPGGDRWKSRSKTYQGIANAMAEQWG